MSTSSYACAVCGMLFKRLQAHLAQTVACKLYYMSRVNAAATLEPTIWNNTKVNHRTCPNSRTSLCESSEIVREAGDPLHHVKE